VVTPAQSSRRFLAPGDKLGKHDVIRQIAVGGMAELYLTRTMGLEGFEKLVCVKRILPQYVDNPSFVNMFLNEARLAATLHHTNIAQVYDIGQEGGEFFFSMEYVHGEDLGRLSAASRENGVPISLDCTLTLVAGLCAGLHYAHEKVSADGKPLGVVHRDVSPTNVLVSYDGAVKLVDFGIARAGEPSVSSQTGLKGKISYMSPEQCRGRAVLDRRSDVFSIGTILYELTTGRLPFVDETEYGVLNQIVNRDADPPSTLVPNYPPALDAIVMRALARDPDRRFSTALELQNQLEDFAHDNRLRVSPLVLARLMSTLFPARLEEWDHARAQGAFFVEQHVVRTLIESGKTADSAPRYLPPGPSGNNGSAAGAPISPDSDSMEPTQVGLEPRMSPPAANGRPGPPLPVANGRPSTPLPVANGRPGTPLPVASTRPSTPVPVASTRPSTPVPVASPAASAPPVANAHASGARPAPLQPSPAPNMPGVVPIVRPAIASPIPNGGIPNGGTLVSSATQAGNPPQAVIPTPVPYTSPGSSSGFAGASGGTLVSSATQAGNPPPPVMPFPQAPYGLPGTPGGFGGASGGTLVSSATQAGNQPPPVMPGAPYVPAGGSGGFAGPDGSGGFVGHGGFAGPSGPNGSNGVAAPSQYAVGDVTDRIRASVARPTMVIRRKGRLRLPVIGTALVGVAGIAVALWLTVGRGGANSASEAARASAKAASPANADRADTANPSVPALPAAPTTEPAAGSAAEPLSAAGSAAESVKTAEPAVEPPAQAVETSDQPKPEPETKQTSSAALQEPHTKPAKPKGRGESKKGQSKRGGRQGSKTETKEQQWNDDSPFMPVATPKR